nr:hypothetical protein [Pseudonocardia lacus]
MRDVSRLRPAGRTSRIDAVVVPASRGVAALDAAANLAVRMRTPLVVLCSRQTTYVDAAEHLARMPGCRAVSVDVPVGYHHDLVPTRTSAPRFRDASAGRRSDLSLKRNIGLLTARLAGWGKVLFLDDDIAEPTRDQPLALPLTTVRNLAHHLDSHQVAGLACRDYPDNSVVCHGRRLAGMPQDTFITGAALAVNCNDQPLPFFPDIYNEDWFFFSRMAARRDVAHAGYATQAPFDPYREPDRARQEEFGDLLAEGMYALFERQHEEDEYLDRLAAADLGYWERFVADRLSGMDEVVRLLSDSESVRQDALASLAAARSQLELLSPQLCTAWLQAWAADLAGWENSVQRIRPVHDLAEALDVLGLDACVVSDGSGHRLSDGSAHPVLQDTPSVGGVLLRQKLLSDTLEAELLVGLPRSRVALQHPEGQLRAARLLGAPLEIVDHQLDDPHPAPPRPDPDALDELNAVRVLRQKPGHADGPLGEDPRAQRDDPFRRLDPRDPVLLAHHPTVPLTGVAVREGSWGVLQRLEAHPTQPSPPRWRHGLHDDRNGSRDPPRPPLPPREAELDGVPQRYPVGHLPWRSHAHSAKRRRGPGGNDFAHDPRSDQGATAHSPAETSTPHDQRPGHLGGRHREDHRVQHQRCPALVLVHEHCEANSV